LVSESWFQLRSWANITSSGCGIGYRDIELVGASNFGASNYPLGASNYPLGASN
jgi:hypothetical protein